MTRIDILKELDEVLQVCKDNECGMDCEHVDDIIVFGERLINDTKQSRESRGIGKAETIYIDRLDYKEIESMIKEGMTNKEIIEELNIIEEATYYQLLRRRNIVNENKEQPSYRGIKIKDIEKQIRLGKKTKEISKYFNVPDNSLRTFMRTHNIINPNGRKVKKKNE